MFSEYQLALRLRLILCHNNGQWAPTWPPVSGLAKLDSFCCCTQILILYQIQTVSFTKFHKTTAKCRRQVLFKHTAQARFIGSTNMSLD